MTDYQNIIQLLDAQQSQNIVDVYIPSLKMSRKFRKFSGKHNKEFIRIVTESPIFQYHFLNYIYTTLKELTADSLDISSLTTLDRLAILIQLKVYNTNSKITIDEKELDLTNHIENFKNLEIGETALLTQDNYTVELYFPDLKTENGFEKILINKIQEFKVENQKEHRMLLSDIFLYTFLAYIKSIKFSGLENEINFNFSEKSIQQKIDIGMKLPSNLILEIVKTIETNFNPIVSKFNNIEDDNTSYTIDINPNLFLS